MKKDSDIKDFLLQGFGMQGPVLCLGSNSFRLGQILMLSGVEVIALESRPAMLSQSQNQWPQLRIIEGSYINISFRHYLQGIILLNEIKSINEFFWHAMPEVFWEALQPDGRILLIEEKFPEALNSFKILDRLFQESGFIRVLQKGPGFNDPILDGYLSGWWEKALHDTTTISGDRDLNFS